MGPVVAPNVDRPTDPITRHPSAPLAEEHEFEAARGLPELLPAGERVLWQGSPDWRGLAREAELRLDDLGNGFFIGNALRGLVPARLLL